MPRAERPTPPYIQIQDHYRSQILDGTLTEGERLPSITAIAEEWGVASATAAKALAGLQVEGYVYASTQGSFATLGKGAQSAHDRIEAIRRGAAFPTGQRVDVTEAGIRAAPAYVADLLGVDPVEARVARRQSVTYHGSNPERLSVSWYPIALAEQVLRLASTDAGDPIVWIEEATGRRPNTGRDYFEAREADAREARALGLRTGDTVLAGTYVWSDAEGVIEYGEWVLPRKRVVSFPYTIG
jgi:GntR family transcriptional regulator